MGLCNVAVRRKRKRRTGKKSSPQGCEGMAEAEFEAEVEERPPWEV